MKNERRIIPEIKIIKENTLAKHEKKKIINFKFIITNGNCVCAFSLSPSKIRIYKTYI